MCHKFYNNIKRYVDRLLPAYHGYILDMANMYTLQFCKLQLL